MDRVASFLTAVALATAVAASAGFQYRAEPSAAEKALAVVSTVHEHRAVPDHAGRRVVFHPGWSSRIDVLDARGETQQIYRQRGVHYGPYPKEVALAFRDVGLSLFDPEHHVLGVTVSTTDGEIWTFDELASRCPSDCPPGVADTTSTAVSLVPNVAPVDPRLRALGATERAQASVKTGRENHVATRGSRRTTYHPGWSSRIEVVDGRGIHQVLYRQSQIYHGPYPQEVALGFGVVGLALFDPVHTVRNVSVQTLDGETWSFDEAGVRCPPDCPPSDSISTGIPDGASASRR